MTCSGCLWLLVSERVSDLILNSLALGFVTTVDDVIAHCFFPQYFQEILITAAWKTPKDPNYADEELIKAKNVKSSLVSLATLVFVLVIIELLIAYQPMIPNYGGDIAGNCQSYLQTRRPWCMPGNMDCFPTS